MTKKYELIPHHFYGFHIKALRDIPRHNVKAGDFGGRVEGEHSLSQEGDCWIDELSGIYDDARVQDNALIRIGCILEDNARVSGNAVLTQCSVLGNSIVRDNTRIQHLRLRGNCDLYGDTEIIIPGLYSCRLVDLRGVFTQKDCLVQGPAMSSGRFSLAYRQADGSVTVTTGCFQGTLDEYLGAIEETHENNADRLEQYRQFHANFVKHFS